MAKKRWGKGQTVDVRDYDLAHHRSGGVLRVPKTPVEKIMLDARLKRMKADYLRRHPEHDGR